MQVESSAIFPSQSLKQARLPTPIRHIHPSYRSRSLNSLGLKSAEWVNWNLEH